MAEEKTYHPSYEYSDGDIVLHSSDGIYFRVHSIILKLASGFFRQMLEIPRSSTEASDDAIPLTETAFVISFILELIYPTGPINETGGPRLPSIDSLQDAWTIAHAADKYDVPRALAALRAIVMSSCIPKDQPLAFYALACRWKWTEEARTAATATLSMNLMGQEDNFRILRSIDSANLCDLLELHAKRKEAILKFFDLQYRDHNNFVVYQWECGCSPFEDGTKADTFTRHWSDMRAFVIASLDACPLGHELQEPAFWSKKDLKLWSFGCLHCGRIIINKQYFIKRIGEILSTADLPTTIQTAAANSS